MIYRLEELPQGKDGREVSAARLRYQQGSCYTQPEEHHYEWRDGPYKEWLERLMTEGACVSDHILVTKRRVKREHFTHLAGVDVALARQKIRTLIRHVVEKDNLYVASQLLWSLETLLRRVMGSNRREKSKGGDMNMYGSEGPPKSRSPTRRRERPDPPWKKSSAATASNRIKVKWEAPVWTTGKEEEGTTAKAKSHPPTAPGLAPAGRGAHATTPAWKANAVVPNIPLMPQRSKAKPAVPQEPSGMDMNEGPVPEPWERVMCTAYNLQYFWNRDTEESLWRREDVLWSCLQKATGSSSAAKARAILAEDDADSLDKGHLPAGGPGVGVSFTEDPPRLPPAGLATKKDEAAASTQTQTPRIKGTAEMLTKAVKEEAAAASSSTASKKKVRMSRARRKKGALKEITTGSRGKQQLSEEQDEADEDEEPEEVQTSLDNEIASNKGLKCDPPPQGKPRSSSRSRSKSRKRRMRKLKPKRRRRKMKGRKGKMGSTSSSAGGKGPKGSKDGTDPLQDPWANAAAAASKGRGGDASVKGKAKGQERDAASWGYFEGVRNAMSAMTLDPDENDLLFKNDVQNSIPAKQWSKAIPMLVQNEWRDKVRTAEGLDHRGGVALVKKNELAQVLRQVGQTLSPTAILTMQPASQLHMKGYLSNEVTCSLNVTEDDGTKKVIEVQRWLTQLGVDAEVQMSTDGLTMIQEASAMVKVNVTFDTDQGWTNVRGINIADYLKRLIPQSAFSQISVREGTGTATVMVQKDSLLPLLRKAGIGHVYTKINASEQAELQLDLLMLKDGTTHSEAISLSEKYDKSYGIAKKSSKEVPRFALRFSQDAEGIGAMKKAAEELGIQEQLTMGKYKITGVQSHIGASGIKQMMSQIQWAITEVVYCEENHAVVNATDCPKENKIGSKTKAGVKYVIHIKAMNEQARKAFKAKNMTFRSADGEGQDCADDAVLKEEERQRQSKDQAAADLLIQQRREEQAQMAAKIEKEEQAKKKKEAEEKKEEERKRKAEGRSGSTPDSRRPRADPEQLPPKDEVVVEE